MSLWGGQLTIIYSRAGRHPAPTVRSGRADARGPLRRFRHITLSVARDLQSRHGLIHAVQAFTQIYIVSDGQEIRWLARLAAPFLSVQRSDMGYPGLA
jgi:hypothetical protein